MLSKLISFPVVGWINFTYQNHAEVGNYLEAL